MNYIIKTRDALGPRYLRISRDSYSGRFCTREEATRFDGIEHAEEWLEAQRQTINKQIFDRCEIIADLTS